MNHLNLPSPPSIFPSRTSVDRILAPWSMNAVQECGMRLATKLGRPAEMPIPGMRERGESVPGAWTYVASSRPAILQSPRLSIARSSGLLEPLLNPHVPSGVARWPAPRVPSIDDSISKREGWTSTAYQFRTYCSLRQLRYRPVKSRLVSRMV